MPRKEDLAYLVANCGCKAGALTSLDDETLGALASNARTGAENILVVNELKTGMGVPLDTSVDDTIGIIEQKLTAIANAAGDDPDEDEEDDAEDSDADDDDGVDDDDDEEEATNNQEVTMNTQQYLAKAPPEVREMLGHAQEVLNQSKAEIARQLVANLSADEQKTEFNALMTEPLPELRRKLKLAGGKAAPTANGQQDFYARYGGAAGSFFVGNAGQVVNAEQKAEAIKAMTPPSYNAQEQK